MHGEPGRGEPLPHHDAPGDGVGREQETAVRTAEAAVGGDALAFDLEELDLLAVLDDPYPVLDRGGHVVAAVAVDAEAVTCAATEHLDHPLAGAVGIEALQAGALDDDQVALEIERDAVAVPEAVGVGAHVPSRS